VQKKKGVSNLLADGAMPKKQDSTGCLLKIRELIARAKVVLVWCTMLAYNSFSCGNR
jgi:hypothetical protein